MSIFNETFFISFRGTFHNIFKLDTRCTYSCIGTSGKKLPKPPWEGFSKKPLQRVFDRMLFSQERSPIYYPIAVLMKPYFFWYSLERRTLNCAVDSNILLFPFLEECFRNIWIFLLWYKTFQCYIKVRSFIWPIYIHHFVSKSVKKVNTLTSLIISPIGQCNNNVNVLPLYNLKICG